VTLELERPPYRLPDGPIVLGQHHTPRHGSIIYPGHVRAE
jgi:hypothetical protein